MSVYVTGDTHGTTYLKKILPKNLQNYKEGDTFIISGDFGLIFKNKNTDLEEKYLRILDDMHMTFCFIDGERENYRRLNIYPISQWAGGKVHKIRKNIIHLLRGEVYTIENIRIFCMGGAKTPDTSLMIKDVTWFNEENISDADLKNGMENLMKVNNHVDYILTHTCPPFVAKKIEDKHNEYFNIMEKDENGIKLEQFYETVKFKRWFFGHYHKDLEIDDEFTCLFNKILKLPSQEK